MHDLKQLERGTIEWEAARIAKVFEVEDVIKEGGRNVFQGHSGDVTVAWGIHRQTRKFITLYLRANGGEGSYLRQSSKGDWGAAFIDKALDETMARGLYCLGFDDPAILAQLPPLSAHEKLELRLSLPREFWPEAWERERGEKEGASPLDRPPRN